MLKVAIAAAVLVLLAMSPTPSRADCPDGRCPDGTILYDPDQPAKQERANRVVQCQNNCDRQYCGNMRDSATCLRENWGNIRSCQAQCRQ